MWRVGIVGVGLWVYLKLRGLSLPSTMADWRAFLIMGALNNLIPFTLIDCGQTEIDSNLASIFNAATPSVYGAVGAFPDGGRTPELA